MESLRSRINGGYLRPFPSGPSGRAISLASREISQKFYCEARKKFGVFDEKCPEVLCESGLEIKCPTIENVEIKKWLSGKIQNLWIGVIQYLLFRHL